MSIKQSARKSLRPIKRLAKRVSIRAKELPHLLVNPVFGSASWLIKKEISYGGMIEGVARSKVSPNDRRSQEQLAFGGMSGGDRMLHHEYAETYATYLNQFLDSQKIVLAEIGILRGSGLAIWCDLFPNGRVVGLDIDPSHFKKNKANLVTLGAFKENAPEVYEFDQLSDGPEKLSQILNGTKLDIVIDDGLHTIDAIVRTWRAVKPHLSPTFVYFIEDHKNLLATCQDEFSGFDVAEYGEMTVVTAAPPDTIERKVSSL